MNVAGDIAQLSYKELQALALRYRVPGNIKKKVLVEVLQAAKSGNEAEFSRMLQELRKNRKRKTRKPKDSKLGITSTPLHSPDYVMVDDDYYCQQQQQQPQQQFPYQWIGAEEEIASNHDDKIPHYEEFKQFLLKRIQREFQTCDTNNNQIQDLSVMDLRTTAITSNDQEISLNLRNYPKTDLTSNIDPLAIPVIDRASYQVLKEPEGSSQGSILLKKMLQAPVGANLGEIASSLFWASNLLDNSDTLTAESESNENEDQLETAANVNEYYGLLKNSRGEFLLNEANLRNMETLVPQSSDVFVGEDHCRYSGDMDGRQNYQNWTVTNLMELPESDLQSSRMFHAIYYNNADPTAATNVVDNNLSYQYQTNNEAICNGNQNLFNFDAAYANGTDMMAAGDPADVYYLQNEDKNNGADNGELGAEYFRNVEPLNQTADAQQSVHASNQQAFSNGVRGITDISYQYLYPRLTQETDSVLHERSENRQGDGGGNIAAGLQSDVNQATGAASTQVSVNETVTPFWPKWSARVGNNLENILNYCGFKQTDYAKLGQTSCVYCYAAPIVSQRSSLANNTCSQARRYIAEQRQHSFSPYWLLYDDTSHGMRMTNIRNEPPNEEPAATTTRAIVAIHDGDNPAKETATPISDVWMNQYEPVSCIVEDINAQDSFFGGDSADSVVSALAVAKT